MGDITWQISPVVILFLSHDWSKCIRQSHTPQLKLWNIGEYSSSNILQFQTLLLIREESLYINCGVILDTVLYLIPNFFCAHLWVMKLNTAEIQFPTLLLIREESLYIHCSVILDIVLYLIPNFFSVLMTCESWSWTLQKFHIYKHLLIILWLF